MIITSILLSCFDRLIADINQLVASHLPDSVYQHLRTDLQNTQQLRAQVIHLVQYKVPPSK